jgi:hypothetical protein
MARTKTLLMAEVPVQSPLGERESYLIPYKCHLHKNPYPAQQLDPTPKLLCKARVNRNTGEGVRIKEAPASQGDTGCVAAPTMVRDWHRLCRFSFLIAAR